MDTDSLFLCLNFEGNKIPDKIQLLPAGEYVAGRDGRRWTKRSAESIAQKSNEYLPQHIIDENHATDLKAPRGESAPAMGWFTNVHAEEDGSVWADAVWTSRGKAALENQEYRYISPVFECDASGEIIKIMRAKQPHTKRGLCSTVLHCAYRSLYRKRRGLVKRFDDFQNPISDL